MEHLFKDPKTGICKEIAAVDIQTLRVSVFGEGQGSGFATGACGSRRILVLLSWGFGPAAHFFFEASKETVCLVNCGGFQKRAFVIYDGIHYDVLVRRGPSGPGTWNLDEPCRR